MAKLVSATYGDALFEVALEQNMLDQLFDEAEGVSETIRDNTELRQFLNHPKIVKEDKIKAIENIFEKFVSKEMTGFLITIVTKDRTKDIKDIMEYFCNRVMEYRKIGTAYVTTPVELTDSMKQRVESRLMEVTDYKSFKMKYAVDKGLIGGMVIKIGDRVVDSSIKNKLSELSRSLNKIDV